MSLHPLVHGFADAAGAYERGRPGYPPTVIEAVAEALGLDEGARVADVGAGTGKLSRALLAAGFEVVAVEPLPGLRAALGAAVPDAQVLAGTAEALPLEERSVDAVVCADAYHWFDGPRAVAEFARVTRPGRGGLALLWNWDGGQDDPPAWRTELNALADCLRPEHPSFVGGDQGRGAVDASPSFGPLALQEVDHDFVTDRSRIVDHFASMSWIGALPSPQRRDIRRNVAAILERHGIDAVTVPLRTAVWTARRV
jgi:SAM-dependent methyltransferase